MEVHGRGRSVSLNSYSRRKFVELKFCMFPYLEVYVARSPDESFLDNTIQFVMPKNPDDLVPSLFNYLIAAKGDPGSYVKILIKFYQRSLLLTNCHHEPSKNEVVVDPITIHQDAIDIELSPVAIKSFAYMVDKVYEKAMIGYVGYSYAYEELLPISRCNFCYEELLTQFPLCHFVFVTIVSLGY